MLQGVENMRVGLTQVVENIGVSCWNLVMDRSVESAKLE